MIKGLCTKTLMQELEEFLVKRDHPGRMGIAAGVGLGPAPGQCCLDSCSAVVLGTALPALGQKTKPRWV